jgi:hypothetical protein
MQAERSVLLGPVGGQVHHSGEPDPAREATLDDGLDEIGGKESQRQQHRCRSDGALFARGNLREDSKAAKRWRGRPAAHRPVVGMSCSG